ncbi:MAG: hypothetical protein ACLQPD_18455 [Desulfomonilaceae bacterium]
MPETGSSVVVRTRDELNAALDNKVKRIIIKGELAEKVNTSLEIRTASKAQIAGLRVALGWLPAVPFTRSVMTRWLSIVLPRIAPLTGVETSVLLAVSFLGLALVLLIVREYRKVRFEERTDDAEGELELEK